MSFALGIVGLIAAVVILATKVVELRMAVLKYRKELPQPAPTAVATASSTTTETPAKSKRSWIEIWEAFVDLGALLISYIIVIALYFSKGPATKQDLGALGVAIVFWFAATTLRDKR